jgi:hypothetical protein
MDATCFPNLDAAKAAMREEISLDDFWAYMPMHNYIYAPARAHWPGASVNSRLSAVEIIDASGKKITVLPTAWLDKHKPVEQMTWAPGLPMIIRNRLLLRAAGSRSAALPASTSISPRRSSTERPERPANGPTTSA